MSWHIIGIAAAISTMFAFVPQIIKSFKTGSVRDVSLATLVQLSLGVSLWVIYGIYLKNLVIIMANTITLSTLVILLTQYYLFGRKPR